MFKIPQCLTLGLGTLPLRGGFILLDTTQEIRSIFFQGMMEHPSCTFELPHGLWNSSITNLEPLLVLSLLMVMCGIILP